MIVCSFIEHVVLLHLFQAAAQCSQLLTPFTLHLADQNSKKHGLSQASTVADGIVDMKYGPTPSIEPVPVRPRNAPLF